MGLLAAVGTDCAQAYITIEDTAGTAGLQRFCGNVLSDTNDDTTAGAVTSKYLKQMVFLKLVHTEYQVSHKTQPFWVKVNVQTLAGHAVGTIQLAPKTTFHFNAVLKNKSLFPHCIFFC
jgi:hypothetical protein